MTSRPPAKFLEELGWLTVRWSGLESMIEMSCAYLFQAGLVPTKDGSPPRPFGTRLKFIRRNLRHPVFTHFRAEYEAALQNAENLSKERNDTTHGVYTAWSNASSHSQTVIKSDDKGYVAIQDIMVSEAEISDLSERVAAAFSSHFNLMDRMKSILRALNGDDELGRRMIFGG